MSYKCMMCQQPISKNEDEWGMEISLTKWMHYKCIEHLWDVYSSMRKPQQATRVRCTKDGEYPVYGEMVVFESSNDPEIYIGGYNQKVEKWFADISYIEATEPIYWQPLTSLKAQYERERGEE